MIYPAGQSQRCCGWGEVKDGSRGLEAAATSSSWVCCCDCARAAGGRARLAECCRASGAGGRATGEGCFSFIFWERSSEGKERRLMASTDVCESVLHSFKSLYFFLHVVRSKFYCIAFSSPVKSEPITLHLLTSKVLLAGWLAPFLTSIDALPWVPTAPPERVQHHVVVLVLFFLSLETATILSICPWSWSSSSIPRGRRPSASAQAFPRGCRDEGQPQGLLHPVLWCGAHSPQLRLFGPLTFFSRVCLQVL